MSLDHQRDRPFLSHELFIPVLWRAVWVGVVAVGPIRDYIQKGGEHGERLRKDAVLHWREA